MVHAKHKAIKKQGGATTPARNWKYSVCVVNMSVVVSVIVIVHDIVVVVMRSS